MIKHSEVFMWRHLESFAEEYNATSLWNSYKKIYYFFTISLI